MLFRTLIPNLFTSGEASTTTYDEIRACGESTLDEWATFNTNLSDSAIQNYGESAEPSWTVNTILLAHLNSNYDAGNFVSNNRPVTHWRILRKRYGTTDPYIQIGFIPNTNVNFFYDTTASADVSYIYAIQSVSNGIRGSVVFAEALSEEGDPIEAVKIMFYGWKLLSLDYNEETETGTLYNFVVANETDDFQTIQSRTIYQSGYARFPKIEVGEMKYRSGRIVTMPYQCIAGSYVFGNNTNREELMAFLSNGEPKILKNGSGLSLVVDTFEPSWKYFDLLANSDYTQPYTVSFNFVEIADIEDVQ